jgi:predicted nucleotidyltransferase
MEPSPDSSILYFHGRIWPGVAMPLYYPPSPTSRATYATGYVRQIEYVSGQSNMRLHDPLTDALGSPIRVRLLREFVRSPDHGFSGRELARLLGSSASQVNLHLGSLLSQGIVETRTIGRAHVWSLSGDHVLVDPLRRLFESEAGLMASLTGDLLDSLDGLPIVRAVLFGSVARGEETPTSDVDVFVEARTAAGREAIADALSRASQMFALRYGNALSNLVLTRAEVRARVNSGLMESIESEGLPIRG